MKLRQILPLTLIALLSALILASCGGDDNSSGESDDGGSQLAQKAEEEDACQEVDEPDPKVLDLERPALKPTPGVATFSTSCGIFTIRLDTERAPKTTASFEYLIEQGVYDDTTFHRVAPSFLIQGGDPTGEGTMGAGYFVDEAPPADLSYTRGIVSMGKSPVEPPGRSGSQFFIVTAPADAGLTPDYALIGEVEDGFETVERIEALGEIGTDGPPSQTVIIEEATFAAEE